MTARITTCLMCGHRAAYERFRADDFRMTCPNCGARGPFDTRPVERQTGDYQEPTYHDESPSAERSAPQSNPEIPDKKSQEQSMPVEAPTRKRRAQGDAADKPKQVEHREYECEYGGYSCAAKTSSIAVKIAIPKHDEPAKRAARIKDIDALFCGAQGEATLIYDPGDNGDANQGKLVETAETCVGIADVHSLSLKDAEIGFRLSFNADDEPDGLREFRCRKGKLAFVRNGDAGETEETDESDGK